MIDISSVFPQCKPNNCLESENSHFIIIDTDSGKSTIYRSPGNPNHPFVKVINLDSKEVFFLAIDHCIFFDFNEKKCDCAVFDNKVFCFIEIKKAASKARRSTRKKEAVKQLRTTIILFKEKISGLPQYSLEALLCIGYNRSFPKTPSTKLSIVKEFTDKYNVELLEGNELRF